MTDKELYEKCIEAGKSARKWKNEFVAMLPEISKRGLHKKHGFATIVEFAAKVGGVGKSTVKAIFQLEKHIEDKPVLKELIPEVGVAKIRVIATIATKENQKDLAKKVKNMSKAALEMYAREKRKLAKYEESNENNFFEEIPGCVRKNVSFGLDEEVEFALRKFKNDMGGEKIEWNDVIKVLLEKAAGKMAEKDKVKKKVNVSVNVNENENENENGKKITRHVPASIKQTLPVQCQFPGCCKPAQLIHHPHRFALNPNHNNLKPLCKAHHELVHNGVEPLGWGSKTLPIIEQKFQMARLL